MRRHVTIPARNAVAATLLLTGAIYVAAEVREARVRRYSETKSLSASDSQPSIITQADNQAIGSSDHRANLSATPAQQVRPAISPSDEVAAEQQAATLPAQKPVKKPATKADSHKRQIVISISDRKLALLQDGELVKVYLVAVGAEETPSPDGEFTIINHAVDPTYRHEAKEIAPGKNNPLGTRWMGLSLKGYGIHGTNLQSSVGKAASHGCFRMKKKDVEELYARVQVGDQVSIRSERDELTVSLFTTNTNAVVLAENAKPDTQIAAATTASVTAEQEQ